MEDLLTLDIQPTVHNNVLIYIVQVVHQKYVGSLFGRVINSYTAPNGFRLSSQARPALYTTHRNVGSITIKGEVISGTWNHSDNVMCVRGTNNSKDYSRMYIDSIVYIEQLKSAVVEYNKYMQGV